VPSYDRRVAILFVENGFFFFFFWCFHSHSIGGDFGFFRNLGVHFNGPDFLGGRFMDGPGKGEKWTR
jgi:hypothetical protein